MKGTKSFKTIRNLGERSNYWEIIRLLCYEKDYNPYCQRYVLKLFIDEFSLANACHKQTLFDNFFIRITD